MTLTFIKKSHLILSFCLLTLINLQHYANSDEHPPEESPIIIDVTKLASADKKSVANLIGEATSCTGSPYGDKCIYDRLNIEITFLKGLANLITINKLESIEYNKNAIVHLGLTSSEPQSIGVDMIRWENKQGLLSVSVFKGDNNKLSHAYVKTFADYKEAEEEVAGLESPKKSAESKESAKQVVQALPVNRHSFEENLYNFLTNVGLDFEQEDTLYGSSNRDTIIYSFNESNLHMSVEYLKASNDITTVMFSVEGPTENPEKTALHMLLALNGIVASLDPSLSKSKRNDLILNKLKISKMKKGSSNSYEKNGINYFYDFSAESGFFFIANKAK